MSYSRPPTILELIKENLFKKKELLENAGYYKTMTGSFRDSHGHYISASEVRKFSYEALKKYLRGR